MGDAGSSFRPLPIVGECRQIRDYVILELIGEGSFGAVFLARRGSDGELVALKVFRPAFPAVPKRKLKREAARLKRTRSVNVVRYLDYGTTPGLSFLATELVRGGDLRGVVRREGPLRLAAVVDIARQVARGLEVLHDEGLLHRDLKPSNLLLQEDGAVKVGDFGSTHSFRSGSRTRTPNAPVGTTLYMSPEQWLEPSLVCPASDLWSLAAVLWFLSTGRHAFGSEQDDEAAIRARICSGTYPSLVGQVEGDLEEIKRLDAFLCSCLQIDLQARPQDAVEFRRDLGLLALRGRPYIPREKDLIQVPMDDPTERSASSSGLRPWLVTAAVATVSSLALVLPSAPEQQREPTPPPGTTQVRVDTNTSSVQVEVHLAPQPGSRVTDVWLISPTEPVTTVSVSQPFVARLFGRSVLVSVPYHEMLKYIIHHPDAGQEGDEWTLCLTYEDGSGQILVIDVEIAASVPEGFEALFNNSDQYETSIDSGLPRWIQHCETNDIYVLVEHRRTLSNSLQPFRRPFYVGVQTASRNELSRLCGGQAPIGDRLVTSDLDRLVDSTKDSIDGLQYCVVDRDLYELVYSDRYTATPFRATPSHLKVRGAGNRLDSRLTPGNAGDDKLRVGVFAAGPNESEYHLAQRDARLMKGPSTSNQTGWLLDGSKDRVGSPGRVRVAFFVPDGS